MTFGQPGATPVHVGSARKVFGKHLDSTPSAIAIRDVREEIALAV